LEERCLPSFNVGTHIAGPNVDASSGLAGYQGETTIAINPTNPLNMIAGSNNLGAGGFTEAYVTKDGGATWTSVSLGEQGDPGVAFDRHGNAFFSYIDNNFGIGVKKSTDGGMTWTANFEAVHNHGSGIQDKPAIAIGPDATDPTKDRIYIAWDDNSSNDVVKVVSALDGSAVERGPITISGAVDEFFTAPAVGPQGQFYLAYTDFAVNGKSSLLFTKSLDGGSTFSAPVVFATSTINTFFPSRYTIPAQNSRGISPNPGLAVENSGPNAGRIYFVYDTAVTGQHNNTDVELIASDDGGTTWTALGSTPVKVNDDTGTASQFFPAMAIDQTNGSVDISWYDTRNDSTNKKVDVFFQDFSSAGVKDGPNVKVTTNQSDESNFATNNANQFGDYTGIAATGGTAYPVWTDHHINTLNSEEIYVDPPVPGAETAAGDQAAADAARASAIRASQETTTATSFGNGAAPVLVGAGLVAAPWTPVVASVSHSTPALGTATHAIGGGQESAGDIGAILPGNLELRDEALAPAPIVTDEVTEAVMSTRLRASGSTATWDNACDECFASEGWGGDSISQDQAPVGVIESPGAVTDLALAAAAVAFTFNGLGGGRDAKSEPRVPRRFPR
jgi:hypothetical protein